jgi:hypothetical protein
MPPLLYASKRQVPPNRRPRSITPSSRYLHLNASHSNTYSMSWTLKSCERTPKEVSETQPVEFDGHPYHWSNVGVRYCIKFVEVKLVVRTHVDVSTFVFSAIAILGRGKDCIIALADIRSNSRHEACQLCTFHRALPHSLPSVLRDFE